MLQTGIPACDALIEMSIVGNIIPQSWYRTIVKKDLKNPKPHLLAINVLSDIVYWYRPVEVRDEHTGTLTGYRKKFSGDLLQRNYTQLAEQFGCSERQAKEAVVFLEELGVIRRVFRTIETRGTVSSNVLFIALDAERLHALTYPSDEILPEVCPDSVTPVSEFCQRSDEILSEVCPNSATPMPEFCQTYTENTTEITTKNSTKISEEKSVCQTDRCVREQTAFADVENPETLVSRIRDQNKIPVLDLKRSRMLVHWLCEYTFYLKHAPEKTQLGDEEHLKAYKLFTECLCSMMTSSGEQTYCDEVVTSADVRDAVQRLAPNFACGELDEFAMETVNIFCDAMDCHNIKNVKGYMKSVIWNGFSEFPVNQETY